MREIILFYGGIMFLVILLATMGFVAMWRERHLKD